MSALKIDLIEGTTRYETINCKDQAGNDFDFSNYEVRTWLSFKNGMYVPTTIVGNTLNFEIPANASLKAKRARAETRIFDGNGKVFEVIRFDITIIPAQKPDLAPVEMGAGV